MNAQALKSNEELMRTEKDPRRLMHVYDISKTDRHAAISAYNDLAGSGSVVAEVYIGYLYKGLGDVEQATLWFAKAYKSGAVDGALHLGTMKAESKNWAEAEPYFRHGAESGDAICKYYLAKSIIAQRQDKDRAEEVANLLRSAADGGSIRAENSLAFFYLAGSCGLKKIPVGAVYYISSLYKAFVEAMWNPGNSESRRLW